jgi:general nucleoside transport system permease protein
MHTSLYSKVRFTIRTLQKVKALSAASIHSPKHYLAASPLILCGLSVAVAFKAGLFNIGAQGQFIFGAIGASFIGFRYDLPVGIHILAAIAFAIILAGIWGGIVGFLKAKTGAHEVIVTIMLNYIAARFILWILGEPAFLRPGRIDPLAPPVRETSRLPLLFGENYRVNVGLIVALAVAALVYFILNRTTLGFRFRAVGANATAARTAGISVGATTIAAMILAGALAGVGGAVHVLGNQYELTTDIAGSFGFDAITVALLGRGSPIGVVLASILFAALRVGGVTMQANVQVPVEIVLVIQALVVLFIAAPGLVAKIFRVRKYEKAETLASKGWNG